jgi:hypothetical protein
MVTSRIWFTAAQKAELWERWKNAPNSPFNLNSDFSSSCGQTEAGVRELDVRERALLRIDLLFPRGLLRDPKSTDHRIYEYAVRSCKVTL